MATSAQINANRENAQRSTGPTTATGKSTSSQNGLKHGLASSTLIIQGESEDVFNTLLAGLLAEHKPETLTETLLIQDMAKYHWLIDRALGLQSEVVSKTLLATSQIAPELGLLVRYQTANERAFQRAFATFTAMRKARLAEPKPQIGSASKSASARHPQPPPADPAHPPSMEEILSKVSQGYFYNFGTGIYDYDEEAAR